MIIRSSSARDTHPAILHPVSSVSFTSLTSSNSFLSCFFRTLPFSVSCKSFPCHSYKNYRDGCHLFPKRNPSSPVPAVRHKSSALQSDSYELLYRNIQPSPFRITLLRKSTGVGVCALALKHEGWKTSAPGELNFACSGLLSTINCRLSTCGEFRISEFRLHGWCI